MNNRIGGEKQTFEMWSYRRMLKIRWIGRIRNKNMLEGTQNETSGELIIRKRDKMVVYNLKYKVWTRY